MKAENGKGRVSKLEPLSDDILLLTILSACGSHPRGAKPTGNPAQS